MKNLNLELSVAEVNVVLTSLNEGPFKVVAPLINKIQGQAQEQLKDESAPVPEDKKKNKK